MRDFLACKRLSRFPTNLSWTLTLPPPSLLARPQPHRHTLPHTGSRLPHADDATCISPSGAVITLETSLHWSCHLCSISHTWGQRPLHLSSLSKTGRAILALKRSITVSELSSRNLWSSSHAWRHRQQFSHSGHPPRHRRRHCSTMICVTRSVVRGPGNANTGPSSCLSLFFWTRNEGPWTESRQDTTAYPWGKNFHDSF